MHVFEVQAPLGDRRRMLDPVSGRELSNTEPKQALHEQQVLLSTELSFQFLSWFFLSSTSQVLG